MTLASYDALEQYEYRGVCETINRTLDIGRLMGARKRGGPEFEIFLLMRLQDVTDRGNRSRDRSRARDADTRLRRALLDRSETISLWRLALSLRPR
jgi:hypothetical protein